jgi:hypothetical protein
MSSVKSPVAPIKSVDLPGKQDSHCLVAPVRTYKGQLIGVIRRARDQDGDRGMFTDDDLAVLDAARQARRPKKPLPTVALAICSRMHGKYSCNVYASTT